VTTQPQLLALGLAEQLTSAGYRVTDTDRWALFEMCTINATRCLPDPATNNEDGASVAPAGEKAHEKLSGTTSKVSGVRSKFTLDELAVKAVAVKAYAAANKPGPIPQKGARPCVAAHDCAGHGSCDPTDGFCICDQVHSLSLSLSLFLSLFSFSMFALN
jgi:hypothetical protein